MLLLNKREKQMAARSGGGNLQKKKKNTSYLCTEKNREIGREHQENTENSILTRT